MSVDDVFLSRVGHDLRGELATMVTGVHYVLRYEAELGDNARQMLNRVHGAGQRLRRLLDELDDAAWIDGGNRAALTFEPCQADTLIRGALARLSQVVSAREVTLDVRVPEDLPSFQADERLSGAAIEYLIDFALARSQRKATHITVEEVQGAPVLRIADEGGAIDDQALARLFDPFVEKDLVPPPEPGQRRRERLGLGLSIAHGILAAHGGALCAEVAPGGTGIVFTCTLGRPGSAVELHKSMPSASPSAQNVG
jgi:two-component system, OmpR family, sensor kinase